MSVLVNLEKAERAQTIVALCTGKKTAHGALEAERMEKWTPFLANLEKGADQVEAVYVALGGLVRTEAEQKAAVVKAEKMKKSK